VKTTASHACKDAKIHTGPDCSGITAFGTKLVGTFVAQLGEFSNSSRVIPLDLVDGVLVAQFGCPHGCLCVCVCVCVGPGSHLLEVLYGTSEALLPFPFAREEEKRTFEVVRSCFVRTGWCSLRLGQVVLPVMMRQGPPPAFGATVCQDLLQCQSQPSKQKQVLAR